jgi:2-polyprenyl-3-methyl-5-hydroxy-6-metoxy-1,4-benzoquinol methylase
MKKDFRVIIDSLYGYRKLDPLPSDREVENYYTTRYYQLLRERRKAPELYRLLSNNSNERGSELHWLQRTLYNDILYYLKNNCVTTKEPLLLDVGSGTGDFVKFIADIGWRVIGTEPSKDTKYLLMKLRSEKLEIVDSTLESFYEERKDLRGKINVITLLNVLEHVKDPYKILSLCSELCDRVCGVICVRVPNDFNQLQYFANGKVREKEWWISFPDHINYFNFESLEKLLQACGFEIMIRSTDFPMELFLLMGDNYVDDDKVGSVCHRKRRDFELSISQELRLQIYQCFAHLGIGRNCLVFGRVKK